MIAAATVERFRGLRRLEVKEFGRVNLIIGKNGCGKTTLMEALAIAEGTEGPPATLAEPATWALNVLIADGDNRTERILRGAGFPPVAASASVWWVSPNKGVGVADTRAFSRLEQAGREAELLEVLREVDSRVTAIELLAVTGTETEVFVRLAPDSPLVPLATMGDGFQRCFEIAVGAVTSEGRSLFVDQLDNGLHHSALEPVWRWLAVVSSQRDLQVFATTHSEECIYAACGAFTALNDEGFRVICLDRRDDHTTAAIYSRELVETAAEIGIELRG